MELYEENFCLPVASVSEVEEMLREAGYKGEVYFEHFVPLLGVPVVESVSGCFGEPASVIVGKAFDSVMSEDVLYIFGRWTCGEKLSSVVKRTKKLVPEIKASSGDFSVTGFHVGDDLSNA